MQILVLAQMITPSTLGQADQTSSHQGCTNVNLQLIPSQRFANVIDALCNVIACKGVYIDLHTFRHSVRVKGQMHPRRDAAKEVVFGTRHVMTNPLDLDALVPPAFTPFTASY